MQTRPLVVCMGMLGPLAGCPPSEQATTGDAGDTGAAPSTSTITGTPTTSGGPTTSHDDTAGTSTASTSGAPDPAGTTDASTSSSTGDDTTTGDTTTGEIVACDDPWDAPTACTSPACQSVTRAWTVCDDVVFDEWYFDYRFAEDGSVLTYLMSEADPPAKVVRVAPDGAVEVVFSEALELPSFNLNRTAVNFSAQATVEGASFLDVFAANGKLLSSHVQAWCNDTYLIPDSQWLIQVHGNYLGEKSGCEIFGYTVLDADGADHASWLPDVPDGYAGYARVSATGLYYVGDDTLYRRDLDGALAWTVQGLYAGDGLQVADLVDRQIAIGPGGIYHVLDGVLHGPADVSSYRMRIAPHGVHSAVLDAVDGVDTLYQFVDGELVGAHKTGFANSFDFDVSDRGEVAVWAGNGDVDPWLVLFDAAGAAMWKAPITNYRFGKGLAFSQTGDELVLREADTLRMFRIDR